jgi:dTDP-glucose 4,6-dehydratase
MSAPPVALIITAIGPAAQRLERADLRILQEVSRDTILITGGAGFIGTNLVNHALQHTSDTVVVVDKMTYAANQASVDGWRGNPRVTFVQADIADDRAMSRTVAEHRPHAILNLAAETHVDRSIDSPRAFIDTNICGTFVLLEVARRFLATLTEPARKQFRFLHVSTDEVYGTLGADGLFTEETPYSPSSPYSASKAGADHLVRAYFRTYGVPALITNCSNNYGPFQHAEKLIPLTILNALDARELPIYGDGGNVRDWLHVGDHCSGLMTVLQRGTPGEQYNVGASNEQTNLTIVDTICDLLQELAPPAENPAMTGAGVTQYRDLKRFVADRPGHDRRYAVDGSKLQRELGWEPRYSFHSGLRDTVSWYITHRDWFESSRLGYNRQRLGLGTVKA